jgi:putative acyl-CoA dehydrogenase
MRVARSYDEGKSASAFRRFATAVEKYWVCKRAPQHAIETLECLGGNGYVEESRMPRHYRDSPLNSIWEGSGNVAALDVLRAMVKEPDGLPAFLEECELARGSDKHLDAHLDSVKAEIAGLVDAGDTQTQARRVVERLALTLQGSLLVRNGPAAVSDAFCAARLGGEGGRAYGTLPAGVDTQAILERALPA